MMYIVIQRWINMPDYKEMYLNTARAMERAIQVLIQSQREAEELYIAEPDSDIRLLYAKPNTEG